ncbi:MAG: circadian clock protein KaiC [Myxococcaceae bacterium]
MSQPRQKRQARRALPSSKTRQRSLPKVPSGIRGLDEITDGGLPRGRPALVCGGAGCGKTLFALEFLVRGAVEHGEPGVFISFEERPEELAANVASLGFDLKQLQAQKKLAMDYVHVDPSEILETGEYDLEGLFVRLDDAITRVGAKRIAIDTIESLFSGLSNSPLLRAELQRLFRWLRDRGITAVITAERGEGTLTRSGLEEYVSDCVILLDHRVTSEVSTRRLRVVKYRGSVHGTNEYPFLIDRTGFSVLPITSLGLDYGVSLERISTGIPRLDEMLGGQGYYRGTTVLLSGTAGTGKTSFAAHLVDAACRRGERCLALAYEESVDQSVRNMRSIGLDLAPLIHNGSLRIVAGRPFEYGLEMHLARLHRLVDEVRPDVVVIDPISNLTATGSFIETRGMMTRLIDFLKGKGITACFTSLTEADGPIEQSEVGISSLIDTWVVLQAVASGGERNRVLSIVKSRGMAHSNQTAEYLLTDQGVRLVDTYVGPSGVLTGSARVAQEARDRAETAEREQDLELKRKLIRSGHDAYEAQLTALKAEHEAEQAELRRGVEMGELQKELSERGRERIATSREAFETQGSGE